jgi:thioredoxin 1
MVVEIDNVNDLQVGNVLADFYAPSCAPCKALSPVLEEISKEYTNITFAKVEVTRNPEASQLYGVMSVPTLIFFKDSKIKEVSKGLQSKNSIKAMLERHVRKNRA